jgi:hypothetical protein
VRKRSCWRGLRNESASKLEKVEVASTLSFGADVEPRAIDLAMRITKRMFLKMKEDEAKNKIEEEENCGRTSQGIGPTCTCPCPKDLRRPCMCTR